MYQIIILPHFYKQLKQYAKKYRHLKSAIINTLDNFDKKRHISLGNNVYKIRLKTPDMKKGKSKSFRLIVLLVEVENFIVLLAVYYKGDQSDISKKEINDHLELILQELSLI